tara:strand:- start:46695 stop:47339 length:645 start_codon:yes stop_codon:yes gene_type:complete
MKSLKNMLLLHSFLFIAAIYALPFEAQAFGVSFEAAIGYPNFSLTNTDGSKAFYDGISVQGAAYIPAWKFQKTGYLGFGLGLDYYDLNNTANNAEQVEKSNHLGPFIGVHVKLSRFFFGYNYNIRKTRIYWVGDFTNDYTEFEYNGGTLYAGMEWTLSKKLDVGITYTQSTNQYPSSVTHLSDDIEFSGSTIWLTIKLGTGQSVGKIFDTVFIN